MKYLGFDLGTKTLGISISDSKGIIALPLTTLRYNNENYEMLLVEIKKIITENNIDKIVLGLPKNMNNTLGERALKTLDFKNILENKFSIEVIMQDERLSTMEVHKFLIDKDVTRNKRKKVVDKMASQVILQSYLDKINNERN
ncbi:MAG: Holliday junction resolvase RuvX [Bacilli bacterium]|nr:Holliday junction resolvase RuvX [Bacilli bacterium]